MDLKNLAVSLEGIRHLLSHLQCEVTTLEERYDQILRVLRTIEKVSLTDELTGLLRRGPFFGSWKAMLGECQQLSDNCGVLLVDIDHFKKINDTHGHPTGDEVLKRVGQLLKRFESPRCFSGRYGGEEFAVAIRGTDAEILGLAEMIRRGVERLHGPVITQDGNASNALAWKCTLSVGMASNGKAGYDADRLLRAADAALYDAKKRGRNRVRAA